MRRSLVALGVALIVSAAGGLPTYASDFYRVNIRRIDQDLYQDQINRVIIKTRYCYEYVYGEDVILVWDGPYSYGNKLIFNYGSTCEVEGVYRG